ncbi:MAG: ribosome maturation factor RimM [Bacillota bacterium]|nr:ribosome maturation factor RimM [Bacillota bacterium]
MNANNDMILVGALIAPHGIAGCVTADCLSDNPLRFHAGAVFFLDEPVLGHRTLSLESLSPHKGRLLLKFAEIPDRNAAELLRGRKLLVPMDQLAPLPEGEYYHFQIIGLKVLENGQELGEIVEVLDYTANDIYVLQRTDGRQTLIPALKSIVKRIDPEAGCMEVQLPPGL